MNLEEKKEIDNLINEKIDLYSNLELLYITCSILDNLLQELRYNIENEQEKKDFEKIENCFLTLIAIFNKNYKGEK